MARIHSRLRRADLLIGANRIWPVPAALLVAPLTVFSTQTASILFAVLLVAALGLALWLLGVTDWRVYGIVALWPPTFSAVQTGNLTIILVLLVAVMWRFRDRRFVPGLALGLAVALKLYLWPLGIWLLARRRFASAALAGAIACGGTLLVLPFITLTDYARLMKNLGDTFGPQGYNVVGLIVKSGAGSRRDRDRGCQRGRAARARTRVSTGLAAAAHSPRRSCSHRSSGSTTSSSWWCRSR